MSKIGISTVYTGYNYGSALQAYAIKCIIDKLGYEGVILHLKGSIVSGRDIRLKKIVAIALHIILHPIKAKKKLETYFGSVNVNFTTETKNKFNVFYNNLLQPKQIGWSQLRKISKDPLYIAFLCGSDQIWNADTMYVDPQYYLRYAPYDKRIAFAPSFGRENIADYNQKIISKYISEIPFLSVREESGVSIIRTLINREATHLIDPTLMMTKDEWDKELLKSTPFHEQKPYLLAYFLNEPSENAKKAIRYLATKNNLTVVALPYECQASDWFDKTPSAGPIEFLHYIKNASCVCTDSFHGTAFAINFNVPFFSFERQYGTASTQSSRLISLLNLMNLSNHFYSQTTNDLSLHIDFKYSLSVLKSERVKASNFLINSLQKILETNE